MKPKKKREGLTLEESLDILDIDKRSRTSLADEKRGAIEVVKKALSGEIQLLEFVESFETSQCWVNIFKTDKHYLTEDIYVITSVHKNNGKYLIRFGNACQIANIRDTYKKYNSEKEYIFQREQG